MRRNPTDKARFGSVVSLLVVANVFGPPALRSQAPELIAGRFVSDGAVRQDCASCRSSALHPWSRSFGDPLLQDVYEELVHNSPTLRQAMDSVASRGFVVRIADITELAELNEDRPQRLQIWPSAEAAGATIYSPRRDGRVNSAWVVIDVHRLHELARPAPGAPVDSTRAREYLRDTLIHELYGHVAPLGQAGHTRAAVPDARPGEPYERSRIGIRENRIRQELGLPLRTVYGLIEVVDHHPHHRRRP
jgi:hypothetical protein